MTEWSSNKCNNKPNPYGNSQMIDSYVFSSKNSAKKIGDEARKKRNEYEFIDGSYLTPSEAKCRRKSKKSKGGKNVKSLDFPIIIAGGGNIGDAKSSDPQKSSRPLAELIKTAAKKKKKRNGKKSKVAATKNAKTSNEFYGYSELEAILKADDSIINDPDKGILEWADSVLNPSKFYNFSAAELLTDNDDGEESDVIDDVLEDEDDEDEGYIPFKAANPQHRIGVCPKCSSTQTLINFVWECECTKARDISDSFFGIVNDWTQNPIYHGNFQNGKKNGNFHAPTFNASKNKKNFSRGKIYEKKNVYQRGKKDINILTNKFEAVSLNQSKTPSNLQNLLLQPSSHPAPPSSRSSPPNKKPILRSLLQDDPIWALPNSINFAPPTTLYDLITESDDYSTIQHKDYVEALGLKQKSSSGKIDSIDAPILRALLSKPPKIAPKSTSTQTFKCHHQPSAFPESPTTSEFNKLKNELEHEKVHRMAVEGKVAALEMKFSQCLSLIENTLPNITAKLENISLTCDHINKICENTKIEKQSAMDELKVAKEKIAKLEEEHANFQHQHHEDSFIDDIPKSDISEATVSSTKSNESKNVEIIDKMKESLEEFNVVDDNDLDDDDKDSEYSFVY